MSTSDKNFESEKLEELFKKIGSFIGNEDCGTEEDTMPEGYGEFGLEVTNPIPVKTIVGNLIYLDQLWTEDGIKVSYERIGSMQVPNIPSIIDNYRIFANGKEIATLYICPYNKKNSERAPKGFKLRMNTRRKYFSAYDNMM